MIKSMQQYALIWDFSHLFHVAHHPAIDAGIEYDTMQVTINNVEGRLRTMKRSLQELRVVGYDMVFVEDREPKRKNDLWPQYRHNFSSLETARQKQQVKDHLLQNGYQGRFCYSPDNEADDVIATLARRTLQSDANVHVIVATSDRDLWQLISPRISIFNHIKRSIVQPHEVARAFRGCRPRHIPLYKALWGDSGDNIPNLMPFMQRQLIPVVQKSDGSLLSFEKLMDQQRWYLSAKCYELYQKVLPQLRVNYDLVKLDPYCELHWE